MAGETDRAGVRLAELVAALSLGIDLGFGQPMEHVLRQTLIALRLAERIGVDEQTRATVYYTALLINVGCHSDAHEQAKWFGDDIALKSGKYDHEFRSVRGAAAGMRRAWLRAPAAAPLPGRAGVRPVGSPRGRRHDRPPRRDGPGAGAPAAAARRGVGGSRRSLRAVGRPRLARRAERGGRATAGSACPARRVRRGGLPGGRGARGQGSDRQPWRQAVRPPARPGHGGTRRADPVGSRRGGDLGCRDCGRARAKPRRLRRAVRNRVGRDRELRRPEVALHARSRPRSFRPGSCHRHPARPP